MNKKLLLSLFFPQDTLEKWDIKTSKAMELDKFFSRRVECTGKNQYSSIAAFLNGRRLKNLSSLPHVCTAARSARQSVHIPNQFVEKCYDDVT